MNPENPQTQTENETTLEGPQRPRKRGRPPNPQPSVYLFDFTVLQFINYLLDNWRDC
jgi:hypothetical protein